jgi:prepilin-type N-terminal cleavage/methylation domain-containing protein
MRKGFTLVELLIVMSIIAALMSVATPVGLNALAQAKATNVASNFRTLEQALIQMITLEQNPPTSGDILDYLYTQKYISSKPQGFQVTYDTANKYYVVKYINDDIEPTKVKNIYGSVILDTDGKLILIVQKP